MDLLARSGGRTYLPASRRAAVRRQPPPSYPALVTPEPAETAGRAPLLGRRRSFVIDKRHQLRAGLLTATVALVLLVFVNLVLYSTSLSRSADLPRAAPELAEVLRAQGRVELFLVILASVVFLIGVFVISILETHRTAGAAFNAGQRLRDIASGRYNARLKLRRGDNLRELEEAFNRMGHALRNRTRDDIETLDRLAARAGALERSGELRDQLLKLADAKRELLR
jgi:methyl-accepting chemotaxis protein